MGKRGPKPGAYPNPCLVGERFGALVVLRFAGRSIHKKTLWLCRCDCGSEKAVLANNLRSGGSTSCGNCVSTAVKGREREHRKWRSALERCRPSFFRSKDYFERGIRVCPEWTHDFDAFYLHLGPCPPGATLDRIDNDRGYEPGNVRWATTVDQNRNRRSLRILELDGEKRPLSEWAAIAGIPAATLWSRLQRGVPLERALHGAVLNRM